MTTIVLASKIGKTPKTIRKWARVLGFPKTGRDYIFTAAQAKIIAANVREGPGRPPGRRARTPIKGDAA